MSIVRRRWSEEELCRAQHNAARLAAGPSSPCSAHVMADAGGLLRSLEFVGNTSTARWRLKTGIAVSDLHAVSRMSGLEFGVIRDAEGRLVLVQGSASDIPLGRADTMLVHTHVADMPPSGIPGGHSGGGDFAEARRTHSGPGLAIVGPDMRITDYSARGLEPDTDVSYVSDDGAIDGFLHTVRVRPRKPWVPRGSTRESDHRVTYVRSPAADVRAGLLLGRLMVRVLPRVVWLPVHWYFLTALGVPRDRRLAWLGSRMAGLLERAGVIFIKLGQVLSARPDLVTREVAAQLSKLRNAIEAGSAPPRFTSAQSNPLEAVPMEVEAEPRYRASIADVYCGRLANGAAVAIKVRRENTVFRVARDVSVLRMLSKVGARMPLLRNLPLAELTEELSTAATGQTDLVEEARNLLRFHSTLGGIPDIRLPRLYDELSNTDRLVMEYIDGLVAIDELRVDASARRRMARAALRILYRMIFDNGFIHADLHPGNVLFDRDNRIVLLDFGLTATLCTSDRHDFADLFLALATGDGSEVARVVFETALSRPTHFDRDGFEDAVIQLVKNHHALTIGRFSATAFIYELMQAQRRFGLRSSVSFTRTLLAIVSFEGIAKQLDPNLNFQDDAKHFIVAACERRLRTSRKTARYIPITGVLSQL